MRYLYTRAENSDGPWECLRTNADVRHSSPVVEFDGKHVYLSDGTLFFWTGEGAQGQRLFPGCAALQGVHISSVSAAYGKLLLVSRDGALYACGTSSYGECGMVSSSAVAEPVRIPLVSLLAVCPHGVAVTSSELIRVRYACASEKQVCVIDDEGHLWCYGGDGRFKLDSEGRVEVQRLPLAPNRKAIRIVAGRSHFVCLVAPTGVDHERDVAASSETSSQRSASASRSAACEYCKEEEEFRLSVLMERADREAEGGAELQEMVYRDEETSESLRSAAKNLRLEFGRDGTARCSTSRQTYGWLPMAGVAGSVRESKPGAAGSTGAAVGEDDAIEMTAMGSTAGAMDASAMLREYFSFVSLNNMPFAFMDSDIESSLPTDNTTSGETSSRESEQCSPRRVGGFGGSSTLDDCRFPLEVWTWGANGCGQLGHNDLVSRREPCKVSALCCVGCIKVDAGDEHSVALCATGELLVWGSNKCGQLKQIDQPYVTSPSFFKVGSQSSVFDVSARGSQMAVIVSGIDATPTLYICGRSADFDDDGCCTQIRRLSGIEQTGWPLNVSLLGSLISVGVIERNAGDESRVARAFSVVLTDLKFAKFCAQLADVCQRLHERSHVVSEQCSSSLLNTLTLHSCMFAVQAARLASLSRTVLCEQGDVSLSNLLRGARSSAFLDSLIALHSRFVDCVAFGCFADVELGEALALHVNKLCLEHDAESAKQHRRLRKLFQKVFEVLHRLAVDGEVVLDETPNLSEADRCANLEWCNRWKATEQQLNRLGEIADSTLRLWRRLPSGVEQVLKRPARLILFCAEAGAADCRVTNVANLNSRSYLRRGWTLLAVFNDVIAILDKRDCQLFEYPLVWMDTVTNGTNGEAGCVRVFGPEDEVEITFVDATAKSDFLHAAEQWHSFANRYSQKVRSSTAGRVPKKRNGTYRFSSAHPSFKSCLYDGGWLSGKPHGRGHLSYPDGKEYKGRFQNGVIEGYGELSVPKESTSGSSLVNSVFFLEFPGPSLLKGKADVYTGCWHNAQVQGLACVKWADGGTYEGYMQDGLRHGHGVQRSVVAGEVQVYVGGWHAGMRHGYGVLSTNRERYLGMWANDQRQGNGCIVSIDGVFHEGVFDRDRLVRGRLLCTSNDFEFSTVYEGDFEKVGVLCGKGVLQLSRFERIEGQMHGNLLSGEVRLTNAVYSRNSLCSSPLTPVGRTLLDEGPSASEWSVAAPLKWREIFEHFLRDDLGVEPSLVFSADSTANVHAADVIDHSEMWNSLAGSMTRLRHASSPDKVQFVFDDRLEKIPNFEAHWSNAYYAMVVEWWRLALASKLHPVCRLVNGLVEVFTCSYNSVGMHRALYGPVVLEFRSLVSRLYATMRLLFTSLPPTEDLYSTVPPACTGRPTTGSDTESVGASTPSTVSLNSLVASSSDYSPQGHDGIECLAAKSSEEFPPARERERSTFEEDGPLTPACDFIVSYLFSQTYATLFTLYSVSCAEADRRYWERVVYLNAHTDVKLLSFLEVDRTLWPIDIQSAHDLDAPLIRATAHKKFYKSAIHTLQQLSSEFNPSTKLAILAETFSEISACVTRFATAGEKHVWTTDDLLPAFMYVTVRAQLQHLGAEIRLIEDFAPQLRGSGQIELMFTTLRASYLQICKEKSIP